MSSSLFDLFQENFSKSQVEYMELEEYLELCKNDPLAYASAAERMVKAIGDAEKVDTASDPRLSRIFLNRTLKVYPAFKDFYGMEDTVERIVSYFRHAAQGLEERKQILYLLGPVGGGKSSMAERLKELMEAFPVYVLCYGEEMSPVFETPLGLFPASKYAEPMQERYGIDKRYLNTILSPWAVKRLKQAEGEIRKFRVAKVTPSRLEQIAICKTEPGDENNQDISCLVGKTDIRQLEHFSQNDPDAYAFSGALCRSNQGLMEFVEMFKAPIKVLHPLLTATQEGNYVGTEAISAIPFTGMVLAHCFSEDTELLTEDGWRHHDEIEIGDMLATMNRETGNMEYQPALNKFEQQYDGPMYHFCSHATDHLVTPNHKMIYHTQYKKEWLDVTAAEFGETGKIMPVSAKSTLPDYPISDEELRLMVWVVTDGSLSAQRVRFHFKKTRKVERLSALLSQMGISFKSTPTKEGTVRMSFENRGYGKHIPDYYNRLSARQAVVVLQEYAHTDGSRPNDDDHYWSLSTNSAEDADKLQHLAFISGNKSNLCSADQGRYTQQNFLNIRVGVKETRGDNIREETTYSGLVFCFETANHTLVARRNGKVLVTGNSNEAEWQTFRNNKNNEAFLDRICVVKVPYCLRTSEEQAIYQKMISTSDLTKSPLAPETLRILSRFSVLSRLKDHPNSNGWSKMRVYDGENIKETDPKAKSVQEYRDDAGVDEGMNGVSTRFAFKILSQAYNYDGEEIAADPVHVMLVLEQAIRREQFPKDTENKYLTFIKDYLVPEYAEFIGNEIQTAYLEAYDQFGQNLFDRYIDYADSWMQEIDFKDPDTGTLMSRDLLNNELEKIEKAAGIANPKDFRHEVVNFVLRKRARDRGNVDWKAYEKLKRVIEKKMFSSVEELLPVISFGAKQDKETEQKHADFVARMVKNGYTPRQVRRVVEWYQRVRKAG